MPRYSGFPKAKKRTGWKRTAVVAGAALLTAAAARKAFAKRRADRTPLQLQSSCSWQQMCPQACNARQFVYKLPVLSASNLDALFSDSINLTRIRGSVTFMRMPSFPGNPGQLDPVSAAERFSIADASWKLRMGLAKQETYLQGGIRTTPQVDMLDPIDVVDTPLIRMWEKVCAPFQEDNSLLYTTPGPIDEGRIKLGSRQWTWRFSVPAIKLADGQELNLWVSYGGLSVEAAEGSQQCEGYEDYGGRDAVPVGFIVHTDSWATAEL